MVDEEADESLFWLEFIKDLNISCNTIELERLIKEADELVAIFSAGIKTIKSRNNKIKKQVNKDNEFYNKYFRKPRNPKSKFVNPK